MIKKNILKTLFLLFLFGIFISCDNLDVQNSADETDSYGVVHFSIPAYDNSDSELRTVLPAEVSQTSMFFTLKGKIGSEPGENDIISTAAGKKVEKMSYADLKAASFNLNSGEWYFFIEGYGYSEESGYTELITGKPEDVVTIKPGENSIKFNMTPLDEGVGSIDLTFKYNLIGDSKRFISKLYAKLVKIGTDGTVDTDPSYENTWNMDGEYDASTATYGNDVFTITYGSSNTTLDYDKNNVDTGTYLLTICVTTRCIIDGVAEPVDCQTYRSDVVMVAAGSKSVDSSTEINTLNLRQVYPIVYDKGNADWEDDYDYPKYYSPYEKTSLPNGKTKLKNDSGTFIKWIETGDESKAAQTFIPAGASGIKNYTAVWRGNEIYVGADGKDDDEDYGSAPGTPYATVANVLKILTGANTPEIVYTINIVGKIEENISVTLTTADVKGLIFKGYKDINYTVPPEIAAVQKYNSEKNKYTGTAFYIGQSDNKIVPIEIEYLTITGTVGVLYKGSDLYGGAIYVQEDSASITLKEGTIVTGGTAACGAGIAVITGTVTLDGGSIEGCGTTVNATDSAGAGIYIGGKPGNFIFNRGYIKNNGSANIKNGGGIYSVGTVTISGASAIITHNVATNGGGIYIGIGNDGTSDYNGILTLENASITSNIAENGGGLYTESNAITMTGGSITENDANNGGGVYVGSTGAFTMHDGTIGSNTATGNGGGVYVAGSTGAFTMHDGTIGSNTASTSGGGVYNAGSMFMYGTAVVGDASADSANNSTNSNSAVSGGGIYNAGGGGLYLGYTDADTPVSLTGGVYSNYAENGGGLYNGASNDASGKTYFAKTYFASGVIANNAASNSGYGGGVYNSGEVYMHTSAVIGDASANSYATASDYSNTAGYGGGVYNDNKFYLGYSSSTEETALLGGIYYNMSSYGGGIYSNSTLYMNSGNVSYNSADLEEDESDGGGIYNAGGTFTIKGGEISYNKASDCGGGVFNSAGNMFMCGNSVIGSRDISSGYSNSSAKGGGVYNDASATLKLGYSDTDSILELTGGIYRNNASTNGGGVYNLKIFDMKTGYILNNIAPEGKKLGVYTGNTANTNIDNSIKSDPEHIQQD